MAVDIICAVFVDGLDGQQDDIGVEIWLRGGLGFTMELMFDTRGVDLV